MTTGPAKRILVADDDPVIRETLDILLGSAGYQVTQACNGVEAVRSWRDLAADLVITDLFMPDKDGIETIVELRAHSPGIRIIAMSGGGDNRWVNVLGDAKLLGAVLTIQKPFRPAEMLAMVNRILNGQGVDD